MWCSDVEYFKKSFPKAKDADSKVWLSGMDIRINHRDGENSIQIYFDRDAYGIGMSIRHFTPRQWNKISEKYGVDLSDNQAFGNTEYCFVRGADEVF